MPRSKFNEVFTSNEFQSIALLRRTFIRDRNIAYQRCSSRNLRNKINLQQKQYSRKRTHSQIGNRYQPEKDKHDITLQPGQSSIDAKISLLKQPVYCVKKNKKLFNRSKASIKAINRKVQQIEQTKDSHIHISNYISKKSSAANSSDKIKQEMTQHHNIQENNLTSQQKECKNTQSIAILTGKHFRNLTSISSCKNIQFEVQKSHQRLKSSHQKLNSIFQTKIAGAIQSKNIVIRQRQWSPRHSSYAGKTIYNSKDSQHILKKSSLFLVNFLKQKERSEQKNEEHPHIGNIANTAGHMKIIVSKPVKKPQKTYGKVKHAASRSLSNFLGSGNSYIISPW